MKELWRNVVGYEGYYEVSNLGKIRSVTRIVKKKNGTVHNIKGRVLRYAKDGKGYLRGAFCVDKKLVTYKVHRVVALAFIENPENKETVNHINGNKEDNRVSNLEWNTRKENIRHSFKNGLQDNFLKRSKEKAIKSRKLSREQFFDLVNDRNNGFTHRKLQEKYKIDRKTIYSILKRDTYKDLWDLVKQ